MRRDCSARRGQRQVLSAGLARLGPRGCQRRRVCEIENRSSGVRRGDRIRHRTQNRNPRLWRSGLEPAGLRPDREGLDRAQPHLVPQNENRAGRWTSPDPYNGSASVGNPQSWNRYSYVENQPTNFVDPSGLSFYVCFDIVTYGGYDNQPGHTYAHTETVCFVFGGGVPGGGTFDTAGNPGSGGGGDECPPWPTVCQAQKDREAARNFGRKLALREREQKKKFLECFEREMKEVRRQLSNLMDKHFGKWKVKVGLGAGLGLLSAAGPGIGALGGSAVALWDWKVELDEFNRDSFEPTRRAAIETCRAESGYRGRI
ncbi:MAG: hypothetical protein IPN69_25120 [Acidobacteria bacterium]|nr:hypothetical protein [Acidobacteriota bacterium]